MSVLNARYRLQATPATIEARADALALEQSVEMPAAAIDSAWVREHTLGRVAAIERIDDGAYDVTLQLAASTTGAETGQLMNMLFGNCSLQEDVRLIDVELPPALLQAFPGPRCGLAGLRARLGVHGRALTCTALKPQGLSPDELAQLCAVFARAGIDVIKDDHGIADQAYAPFAARVAACQRALREVAEETGHLAVYAPSLSGSPTALWGQVETALKAEVGMLLAAPMIMGLPMFQALTAEDVGCPFLAHPALSGALRIDPPLFYGKLFRLFGADAVIFPNVGGRFSFSEETCRALVTVARQPWEHVAPALPVPAGGMSVARVDEIVAAYGTDTMLLIGGGLLSAGKELPSRAREFVAAVAAATPRGGAA